MVYSMPMLTLINCREIATSCDNLEACKKFDLVF